MSSLRLKSVVNADGASDRQNRVQLGDVIVQQADAARSGLLADGIGVPRAVDAVAGDVQPEPMRAEDVLGIAEGNGLSIGAPPRRVRQAGGDLEIAHRRLAIRTGADVVTLEELAVVGQSQLVRRFADGERKVALIDAQSVADPDTVARKVVGFLD